VWVLLCLAPILALTSLHLRGAIGRPARSAGTAVLALVAGFYAFRIFDPDHVAEIWRVMGLTAAGVSFLLLTPAVPPRVEGRFAHWHFAFGFLARATLNQDGVFELGRLPRVWSVTVGHCWRLICRRIVSSSSPGS
jgi:hypothetical protein